MPLTAKQVEAAGMLALGELSRDEVAERVGTSVRTLYRWIDDDDFQAEVTRQARRLAHALIPRAISRLQRILEKGPDNVAHSAIVTTLKLAKWLGPEAEPEATEAEGERPRLVVYLPENGREVPIDQAIKERGHDAVVGAIRERIEDLKAELGMDGADDDTVRARLAERDRRRDDEGGRRSL